MAHLDPPAKLALAAAVLVAVALLVTLSLFIPSAFAQGGDDPAVPPKPSYAYPNLSAHLNHLAEGYGSGRMSQGQAAGQAPVHSGGSVAVTIYLDGHVSDVVTYLEDNGGDPRNVGSDYVEAYVPVSLLGPLSLQPGVTQVQEIIPPQPAYGNVTSQAVALHLADSWQDAGYQGQGVKVGVIDVGFTGYSGLMGVELPSTVVARCYTDVGVYTSNLADCEASEPLPDFNQCSRGNSGSVHGTAVAEAVIDIAPDAILYISQPGSWGDLQATAAWMASQGVQVINYSVGWTHYGSRGDGTSPYSSSPLNTIDQAVDDGIIWVNAAGNSAEDTWFGSLSDHDGDGIMSFNSSGVEINPITLLECQRYTFQLRWEDSWGGASTDLDMYLWDRSTDALLSIPAGWGFIGSRVPQSGASDHEPFEFFSLRSPIDSNDVGVIIVHAGGPVPNWIQLEMFSGRGGLGIHTGNGSIANPAESANPGLLAVGASPFYDVNTIEPFSSQGPTPDGRIKPDIVGIDCAASVSYEYRTRRDNGQGCWFPGTSQASPHVAGMAALVRQRFPDLTAEETAAYLKDNAEPRGAVPNNTWGYGLAKLPATDVGDCVHELTNDGATTGSWSPSCQSTAADRGYSQYYNFTLEETTQVTIELNSSVDPYLFLRAGDSRSEDFLHENDDIEAGANTNSRITATLTAGAYTIEATTYDTGQSGEFTLTISGLGGGAGEEETTPDGCGFTLTTDGATTGTWAPGCESSVLDRGYARYYTFTLDQQSAVTIDLVSDVDPFLYLRSGTARTGVAVAFNDDVAPGTDTNSRISETLAAGTYTIEATTYGGDQSGTFTLTFTGLDGDGEDEMETEPGDEETDNCAATAITTDGATTGTWAPGCESSVPDRGYARYYTFTLAEESAVTMELTSDVDTYLYLRPGDARAGDALHENDDIASGGVNLNSRISETLAAGTYTIEATTYGGDQSGTFTLTFTGLDGDGEDEMETEPGDEETDNCAATAITTDGATTGTWAPGCESSVPDRGYARYYTFTLAEESAVTMELTSDVDTYLYLRPGDARAGDALHENDDIASGGVNLNSRISETLDAGTYTIEATTYAAGSTGAFTLTISGLGGGTDDSSGTETDQCGSTISADGSVGGSWVAGCQSQVSGRGYARYYTFTLEEASQITIELVSSVDPYLYLRQGEARSGDAEHENDDIESGGVNLNSRISETLDAGTYTIEATTYSPGTAGSFTLTISGLD
ncbi:MAG: S8 family serine peptidase [Chloroflexota bacterium]|nr:S8 family serine peptidase [Chloroflexota bacterium]